MLDSADDPLAVHARWIRERAAVDQWRLDAEGRVVFDDDGAIAVCSRAGDARFILAICRGAEGGAPETEAEPPSPPIWCRDELADGTEAERQLCDGNNEPIISLRVDHPRSAFNEDFILISRNAWVEA